MHSSETIAIASRVKLQVVKWAANYGSRERAVRVKAEGGSDRWSGVEVPSVVARERKTPGCEP
jgi:hypothetical protein